MNMRLLISGSRRNSNTIGAFIIANFESSIEYDILEFPDRFADLLKSRFYRLIYRFFPILLIRRMDKNFVEQVINFRPTIVLIFKGMEISRWSLERVKAMDVKLVNFNFDHPFNHFSRGTGNRFVKEAIPCYDLHISYSSFIAAELQQKFGVRTACIPFGFHLTDEQYQCVLAENRPEINKLCFVGNPDHLRIKALRRLLAHGCAIDLYGFGWEKVFQQDELLTIHQPRKAVSFWTDPVEFWKILRQYRVQLNFFRPHNEGSHNLRTFEVPVVGGILLTPASVEQACFFEEGKEIFFYTDDESLFQKARWLLQQDRNWVQTVRENARNKSITNDYSYRRRTAELLTALKNI